MPTSGSAASVITASDHIAPIQPNAWMSFCDTGANTNCPNEPPALMMPAALPRASAGMRCAAAPISTEKLPAPEPIAESRPSANTSPRPEPMKGVSAVPRARRTMPPISTGAGPAVRDRAGDGLHRAPRELAHREREADRDDAEPGGGVQRRDEESERLPRPHRDHEDRGGGQRDDPRAAVAVVDHLPSTRSGLPFSTM